MAAATASSRVVQAVTAHVKLIKFPNRKAPHELSADSSHTAASASAPYSFPASTGSPKSAINATSSKPIGSTPRGSGIDSRLVPPKYRRKPIEQEEIDYIQRGGPD